MLAKRSAAGKEGKIVRGAASAVIDLFFSIWEGGRVKNGKNTEAICRLHRQSVLPRQDSWHFSAWEVTSTTVSPWAKRNWYRVRNYWSLQQIYRGGTADIFSDLLTLHTSSLSNKYKTKSFIVRLVRNPSFFCFMIGKSKSKWTKHAHLFTTRVCSIGKNDFFFKGLFRWSSAVKYTFRQSLALMQPKPAFFLVWLLLTCYLPDVGWLFYWLIFV